MRVRSALSLLAMIPVALLLLASTPPEERTAALLASTKLIETLQVEHAEVKVQSVEKVDWPDTSLGCPEKGTSYLQVVVPGHRVRLWAEGTSYAVHMGGGQIVVCGITAREATAEQDDRRRLVESVVEARRDLASHLGLPEQQVEIVAVDRDPPGRGVKACVGPANDEEATPAERWPRAVIELGAGDQRFVYQLLGDQVVRCPAAEKSPDGEG